MAGSVRKRGAKWYYSFEMSTVDGKRKRVERVGGNTKKEAEKALREALNEYDNAGIFVEPSEISFADFLNYWLETDVKMNNAHNTYNAHFLICKNHLIPTLGCYKLRSISPQVLQELINSKYLSGFSKSHLNNMKSTLNVALKYAIYPLQYIKDNPLNYVKMPTYQRNDEKVRVLTDAQFDEILARFPFKNPFYIMLNLGYFTGFRIGEVTALTWEDIDLDNGTISVNKSLHFRSDVKVWYLGNTKTKSSVRKIIIGKTLVQILRRHRKWQMENQMKYGEYYSTYQTVSKKFDNKNTLCILKNTQGKPAENYVNFVCTKENGEILTTDSFKYASRIIKYELGIPFNFHALRHTHATKLIENNANLKGVQERLGHSEIATTMDVYVHRTNKIEQETADIFEQSVKIKNILPTKAK